MVLLDDMNIPLIMHTLRERCKTDQIYTNVGTILISINPYKMLPLYTPAMMEKYSKRGDKELPPHPFIIGDRCYLNLWDDDGQNQSILVSGESGAGKTEATKVILNYLADVAGSSSGVEQKILRANPILEAFGNAKTIRNNNSSRFGKWMEIHFDKKRSICGARILSYLLEKSRVPWQTPNERNYHIFYQLLKGAEPALLKELGLGTVQDYVYTSKSGCTAVDGMDDAHEFNETKKSFLELDFTEEEIKSVFKIVAAVLHLGNLVFKKNPQDETKSMVDNIQVLQQIAKLLEIDGEALKKALTSRTFIIGNRKEEATLVPLDVSQAEEGRDSMAKHLYGALFEGLVKRINSTLSKGLSGDTKFIGILDIFGFEIFQNNSFEQLCINFTNEKLQQKFNSTTFKEEEAVYTREKIKFEHVDFIDNQSVLDLIEAKNPPGVMVLLDEELRMPQKSDKNFLQKCLNKHDKNDRFKKPIKLQDAFTVVHYAGEVTYNCNGFLEKNHDRMYDDLLDSITATKSKFLTQVLQEADIAGKSRTSLGGQFRQQLSSLMEMINKTYPHYIRCIKPNEKKAHAAKEFDAPMSLKQLTYAGVFEAVSIRRQGYPFRLTHERFYKRYRCLTPNIKGGNYLQNCREMLKTIQADLSGVQVGASMILYKSKEQRDLDLFRNLAVRKLLIQLQAYWKRYRNIEDYKMMNKVRMECRDALKGRQLAVIEKVLSGPCKDCPFKFKEILDLEKLRHYLLEEIRLDKLFSSLLPKIQDLFEPAKSDMDDLKKGIADADAVGLNNKWSTQAREIGGLLDKRATLLKATENALANSLESALQDCLKEAQVLKVKSSEPLLVKAQKELDRIKEERTHINELLKILSVPPNPLYSGVTINEEGETALSESAKSALVDRHSLAKNFGLLTPEGKKALITATMVLQIRSALMQENWGDPLEQTLLQTRQVETYPAPEIKAAFDHLSLLRRIEETVTNLQKAAQEFDAPSLEVNLAIAQNLRMEGIPPYIELMEKIKAIYAALNDAIYSKTMEKIDYSLHLASEIGYNRQDYNDCWTVRICVEGLLNELKVALETIPEREDLNELNERCRAIGFRNDSVVQLEHLLGLDDPDLFKRQEQAAGQLNNHPRRIAKRNQLKEIFFNRFGKTIIWDQCAIFRSPADFAKSKIIGKDKVKNSMLQWSKETIPTSLTTIEDKLLLKEAVRNFKNIMGWSGDKQVQYPQMVAREVVEKGCQLPALRDEIYVQIIKQLTDNPNNESTQKLWQLMQLCLLHFPPTNMFEHYLESFLRNKGGEPRWYTIRTLHDTQENGVQPVPSGEQIDVLIKQQYPSTREPIDVHRPTLAAKTPVDQVIAINNARYSSTPSY
uniref:Myosin motor domain-containing protein n=1 Tax=Arcella intermedia TaxID=1963864 RepID=A0A6B2KWF1_9EUKA